ncbi:MAG: hypothetical protein WDZ30_08105 [Cellvibrionaceae bacterium]
MSAIGHLTTGLFLLSSLASVTATAATLSEEVVEPHAYTDADDARFSGVAVLSEGHLVLAANDSDERAIDSTGNASASRDDEPEKDPGPSLNLTYRGYGISLGDSKGVKGIRLNYRDSQLQSVYGVNATLWAPFEYQTSGAVTGLALGLPVTGAESIEGIALSLFAAGTKGDFTGVDVSGLGFVAGNTFTGIGVSGIGRVSGDNSQGIQAAGLGLVAGDNFSGAGLSGVGLVAGKNFGGLGVSGVGLVAGDDFRGIGVAGIGLVAGRDLRGIGISGIGLVSGGRVKGIAVGGIAVVGGDELTGLSLAGVAAAGGPIRGVSIAGLAVASEEITGVGIGTLGVAAGRVRGLTVGAVVGAGEYTGLALAPAHFRISKGGQFNGLAVSAWNRIKGNNAGWTIGLLNDASHSEGYQIGLINVVRDNPKWLRVLPLFNRSF